MTPEIKSDISDSSNEIIKSLALPASEQIGQALGNICGLINSATFPIKLANNYAKRNFEKYNERLNEIPKEKIKSVDPEIGIPLFEKLTYTSNEDLANAYANLLANASNIDKVDCIHPGFINKLNNLAPDEVRILDYIAKNDLMRIPYIEYQVLNNNNFYTRILSTKITNIHFILDISKDNINIHFDNLLSLNILSDMPDSFLKDSFYKNILLNTQNTKNSLQKKLNNKELKDFEENSIIDINKSYFNVSSLGKVFLEACTNS